MKPVQEQLQYLLRGIDRVAPEEELPALLEQDRPLRVKFGVDPTAPDVTIGWAVVFDLLRRRVASDAERVLVEAGEVGMSVDQTRQ